MDTNACTSRSAARPGDDARGPAVAGMDGPRAAIRVAERAAAQAVAGRIPLRATAQDVPDVAFRPITVLGDAVTAVEPLSAMARLVVDSDRSDAITPSRSGPPAHDLARHSSCPVLMPPVQAATRAEAACR
ncbi:hypothetical protein [Nocardia aurantiaca]|uniref:Uncharacterized protein n=1 Tax=Nocardia aurantiaca TaxID=2675850 RepID=A0A6I3L132_9NOCA|nr:hypothetical protein [Nocardia aurantiaca]MTE14274.1 hypothetical protein [Nocardia aurantiaca]